MARGARLKASPSSNEQAGTKDAQVEESQSADQDRPVPGTRSRKRAAESGLEARPAKMPAVQIAKRITKVQATADTAVMTRGRAAKSATPSSHPATKPAKPVSQAPRKRKRKSRVQIKAGKRKPVRAHGSEEGDQSADRGATDSSAHQDATDGESEEQDQSGDAPEPNVAVVHRRRGPNSAPKKSTLPVESAAETGTSLPAPRHRRRRRKKPKPPVDDLSRIRNRVKSLIFRLRREQHLLDAYSSEGWKGQSREKLRPERELERAESQILQCKLAIREAIKELDVLCLEGSIDESAFDAEGQIYHEEIFCAKCKSQEALADNDIILCDGFCNRGFHQNCLEPPLATGDIPPENEGWLCPACEAKVDCFHHINAYVGTSFGVETSWEEIFCEAAAAAAGDGLVASVNGEWPSEDDEDDDFDPEKAEKELSEDNDELEEGIQSSSDSGDSDSSDDDAAGGRSEEHSSASDAEETVHAASIAEEEEEDDVDGGAEPSARKRSRKTVDYRRLNDEMFGGKSEADDDQHSEDEDWGPQRRRRPRKGSDDQKGSADCVADLNNGTSKVVEASELEGADVRQAPACQEKRKRVVVRLPTVAIEAMRRSFAVNELPSRASKDDLAKELGLCYRQVDQWFKNMRYHALKNGLSTSSRPRAVDGSGKAGIQDTSSPDDRRSSPLGDGQLLQKLDEVEMKLHELKRTLDMEQANRTAALNSVSPNSGKRIVYVPVAEVVEESEQSSE